MNQTIRNRINQIKSGQVPEGYEKTSFGVFPVDWEKKKRLKSLGSFSKGKGLPGTALINEGVPCVGYGDIYMKYNYHFNKAKSFVDKDTANESQAIDKGTLLFTGTGETALEIGKCICYNGDETIYAGGDILLFNSNSVNPLFLAYQQNIEFAIKQKAKYGQGHSVVHIQRNNLEKLNVAYPKSQTEQAKIAEILMKWDEAIEAQEQLIQKLEIRKKALLAKVFVQEKSKSEKLARYIVQKSLRNKYNSTNVLSVNNKLGFIKQEEQFSKIVASNELKNYKIVRKGDIAFNPSRINVGSIALYDKEEIGIISPMYIVFSCKEKLDPYILLLILNTNKAKYLINSSLAGSVRDTLTFEALSEINITIPSREEQINIKKLFVSLDEILMLNIRKLEFLQQQRKSLMQLLLTGIVRVVA